MSNIWCDYNKGEDFVGINISEFVYLFFGVFFVMVEIVRWMCILEVFFYDLK